MSSVRRKIKYYEEGEYGQTIERTVYCVMNNSCDITTFYDENGEYIFSYCDTVDGNLFNKMNEIVGHSRTPSKNVENFLELPKRK